MCLQLPPAPMPDGYESPINWGSQAALEQHTQGITAAAEVPKP